MVGSASDSSPADPAGTGTSPGLDGVIHFALQFCSPYQIEAPLLERTVERNGTPVLRIDTDYSAEDVEQLRTRVEAFVEQLSG